LGAAVHSLAISNDKNTYVASLLDGNLKLVDKGIG
jgi:hypothetical protein